MGGSWSPRCLIGQGGAEPTLSPLFCLMQETESSAWVTTTAPSTPRSMAHTEQGLPVPARHQLPPGNHFDSESFTKNISPPNTKVSNVPHTSFFVSLLILSEGLSPVPSPRYDITVTHKDYHLQINLIAHGGHQKK